MPVAGGKMRTVDDFAEIRRLHRNKPSIRAIALKLSVGRGTVRKALANPTNWS